MKGAAAAGVAKAKEAADVAKAHLLPLPAEEATPKTVRSVALLHERQNKQRIHGVHAGSRVPALTQALHPLYHRH